MIIYKFYSYLSTNDYEELGKEIRTIFPNEKPHFYFIPPIKINESRKKKSERARGTLVDLFKNELGKFRRRMKGKPLPLESNALDNITDSVQGNYFNKQIFKYY